MISYLNPENCGGDFQEVALIMTIQIFLRNKTKQKNQRNSFRKAALSSGNLCSVVVPSIDMPTSILVPETKVNPGNIDPIFNNVVFCCCFF